jgi:hypothetical protein
MRQDGADGVRQGPMTTTAAGVLIMLCGLAAGVAAAVPASTSPPGRGPSSDAAAVYSWYYPPAFWLLTVVLVGAGLAVARRRGRRAAAVAAIVAAQLVGIGVVAVRDWFNVNGAIGMAQHNLATVVTFAVAGAIGVTAAVCLLWREPQRGWRGLVPARWTPVLAGAALAVALPPLLGMAIGDVDVTTLGQFALTYSLPWGAGLAAIGWLRHGAAVAAASAVVGSALVAVVAVLGVALT